MHGSADTRKPQKAVKLPLPNKQPGAIIVVTPLARQALARAHAGTKALVKRHADGDPGQTTPHDLWINTNALSKGFGRVLTTYVVKGTRLCVVSEVVRLPKGESWETHVTCTTVMLAIELARD